MHRREEVFLRRDSLGLERLREVIAIHAEGVGVHKRTEVLVSGPRACSNLLEFDAWNAVELALVPLDISVATLHIAFEMAYHFKSDDRVNFRHPSVQPGNVARVVGMVPVVPEKSNSVG